MVRGRAVLLLLVALLVCASSTIAAPEAARRGDSHTTAVSAPVLRAERAVLAPVSESRTLPLAPSLGVLAPAAVVAAALGRLQLRRLPGPRRSIVALQIPRLRGPPPLSSL